jgi:hypothetical protein
LLGENLTLNLLPKYADLQTQKGNSLQQEKTKREGKECPGFLEVKLLTFRTKSRKIQLKSGKHDFRQYKKKCNEKIKQIKNKL